MPLTLSAAIPNTTAGTAKPQAGVVVAISRPPRAGPISVPIPSNVLDATFDATSSSGDRARAGISGMWVGRCRTPRKASSGAMAYTNSGGRPAMIAMAARPTRDARPM